MRIFIALLIVALFAPAPGVTLTATMEANDLTFEVRTDVPRKFYVQIDTTNGVTIGDSPIYEFDLGAGEGFGRRLAVSGAGTITIRVWASDGGAGPIAEQAITAGFVRRVPILLH